MEDVKEATKRPWEAMDADRGALIVGAGSEHIARINNYYGDVRDEANAALIVRAVNSFDQMREALKEIESETRLFQHGDDNLRAWIRGISSRARAALAASEPQP